MRKIVCILAALAVVAPCAAVAAPLLSMVQFRDAYAAELVREHPGSKATPIGDDALDVKPPGGEGGVNAYLDNAYERYRQNPAALQDILRGYIATTMEAGAPPPIEASNLIVLVRPAAYLAIGRRGPPSPGKPDRGPMLARPIAGDLVAVVAEDQPHSYTFASASELRAALKKTDAAIWKLALANTRKRFKGFRTRKTPYFVFTSEDGLAPSLMIASTLWDRPAMQKAGAPLVAPVDKNLIVVVHAGDPAGLAFLKAAQSHLAGDPDALSGDLFVRRNHAWALYQP